MPGPIVYGVVALAGFITWRTVVNRRRLRFLESYAFPPAIDRRLAAKRPQLTNDQRELVLRALRDWFWMCGRAGHGRMVSMPSQAVDDAWHEFILFTRIYQSFCRNALGRFLHHTPAEAMSAPTSAQDGIKRAWRLACARDKINPKTPQRLPLIFAIDSMLGLEDGFTYTIDCRDKNSVTYGSGYCASHIGCSAGCSGDSGSDSGGDGGSGGGDGGCGGGCGGD